MLRFEWDKKKAVANQRKHGVSFTEGESVFLDPNARIIGDPDHSQTEDRFVIMGMSSRLRTLVVCHCYRENESVIRIISARKAGKKEQKIYQEQLS